MAETSNNPADPKAQGAGEDGADKKLIFGKYKSLEEAEAGYKSLEKGYHETRQDISKLRETIETRIPEPQPYGGGGTYVPIPEHNPDQAAQVLARFYQNPVEVLREVADTSAKIAEDRIAKRNQQESANRERIQTWLQRNPDLQPHGDILDFYVRQTDGRLAVETRLDAAADRARKRLVELRGTPKDASPNPEDYIPGPSGSREGAPSGGSHAQAPANAESELASYAASRNSSRIKRPGTHGR